MKKLQHVLLQKLVCGSSATSQDPLTGSKPISAKQLSMRRKHILATFLHNVAM